MAKYTITHACGHQQTHQLYGKSSERDRKITWLGDQPCTDCWKEQQEAERNSASATAASEAAERGLPHLQGSEKQIAWAETIRKTNLEKLARIESFAKDDDAEAKKVVMAAIAAIKGQDSAHWWIENRDEYFWSNTQDFVVWMLGGREYLKLPEPEILARAAIYLGGLKKPEQTAPTEIIADAKAEATIRPEQPKTETVAEIHIAGNELQIAFPEKHEDFRLLMRNTLSMQWKDGYWGRLIGAMQGSPDDRLVEAGHRLLAAGFIVRIYDEQLRRRAIEGEFEPEHTRWITRRTNGPKAGWFCIIWGRDEDYYAPARKLPRSQYDKPYVVVPPEQFEEVLDFAGRYVFRLTGSGTELAEQARVNRDAALIAKVDVKPKAKGKKITDVNKPEAIKNPENAEVDDALRDE